MHALLKRAPSFSPTSSLPSLFSSTRRRIAAVIPCASAADTHWTVTLGDVHRRWVTLAASHRTPFAAQRTPKLATSLSASTVTFLLRKLATADVILVSSFSDTSSVETSARESAFDAALTPTSRNPAAIADRALIPALSSSLAIFRARKTMSALLTSCAAVHRRSCAAAARLSFLFASTLSRGPPGVVGAETSAMIAVVNAPRASWNPWLCRTAARIHARVPR
mmetsp:Transcript_4486/g.10534  ORF Transcript_4486/g.10534 Transcript_4486/m.10534 type:complete len:223 (-) Transcript_4486:731-1399(-)